MTNIKKLAVVFAFAASAASPVMAGGPVQNSKPTPTKGQAFTCALSAKQVIYSDVGPTGGSLTSTEKSTWSIISVASQSLLHEIALTEGKDVNHYSNQVNSGNELAKQGRGPGFLKDQAIAAQIIHTQICAHLFVPGMS